MVPNYEFIKVELLSNVLVLMKYNRPRSGNALHPKLLADAACAFQWIEEQRDIRIVIVTGEGYFFCTGMDLSGNREISFAMGSDFHRLNEMLIRSDKILIAAVNGPAAGYGTSSLALFDLVYSVPDAYFFTPFVKVGMTAEACSSITFPRLMGHQRAAQLFMLSDRFSAHDGEKLGLINKVLPKEGFLQQVTDIGMRLAGLPPGSLTTTKRLMRSWSTKELLNANDEECRIMQDERLPSGEPAEAMKQFMKEQGRKQQRSAKL